MGEIGTINYSEILTPLENGFNGETYSWSNYKNSKEYGNFVNDLKLTNADIIAY